MLNRSQTLFQTYLKCSGNRESTKLSKSRAFVMYRQAIGDIPIEQIRYTHGEDFRGFLAGRSNKTINLYVQHMISFFKWCCKREILKINPWSELTLLPTDDKLTEPFAESEILRMINVAYQDWKVLIILGYVSGLRQSEALNLLKTDFSFEKEMLSIIPKKDTPETWKWDIKNRKQSYAPFPSHVYIDNRDLPLHQMTKELFGNIPYPFIGRERYRKCLARKANETITKDMIGGNFDRKFKKICELANVRKGRYQGLRVSFIQKLRSWNYDPKKIQSLARHRSLNTTMRYYAYEEEKDLVIKAVEEFKH